MSKNYYPRLSLLICVLFFNSLNAQSITKNEWIQDVEFLENTISDDFSFLFKKIKKEEFYFKSNELKKNIPKLENYEIIVGIAELIASFGYGHTALWLNSWRFNPTINFKRMPLNFYHFKDGVFIQGGHQKYDKAIGAKVIKIGDHKIDEVIELIKPVVSADNEQFFKAFGVNYIGVFEILKTKGIIDNLDSASVLFAKNGTQFEIEIKSEILDSFPGRYNLIESNNDWKSVNSESNAPLWLKEPSKVLYSEYLNDSKTLYIRQNQVQNTPDLSVEDFYQNAFDFVDSSDAEILILDLRLNSGGDNTLLKPIIVGLIKSRLNKFGHLYVITGRRTFSAAQNLVNRIETYTNAIFVGEPTSENVNFYGDSKVIELPNSNINLRLSYLWWQDKDPRDNREWLKPSINIELSSVEYASNIDPTIDHIFNSSQIERKINPLFNSTNINKVKYLKKLIQNQDHNLYNIENRINLLGYNSIDLGDVEEAFNLFKLNSELYPNSPNVWDSLAEGYWRIGDKEMAKTLYNKVIDMAPDTQIALHSQMMLNYMSNN